MSIPNDDGGLEYLELTSESLDAQNSHRQLLLDMEARKRAPTVDVPTLPHEVRDALRGWGAPVRLFGEDLAAIRDRLRMLMARREVLQEQRERGSLDLEDRMWPTTLSPPPAARADGGGAKAADVTETTYTHAPPALVDARKVMCEFSLGRSRSRLERERRRRQGMIRWTRSKKRARLFDKEDDAEGSSGSLYNEAWLKEESLLVKTLDDTCEKLYASIKNQALEGSQYGDVRPLSSVCTSTVSAGSEAFAGQAPKLIATGGWSGGIKIWNGGGDHYLTAEDAIDAAGAPLDLLGSKNTCHQDRIMGIAMRPYLTSITSTDALTIVASASIDLSAKLCSVKLNEEATTGDATGEDTDKLRYRVEECAHLKGHAARLSQVAFHPTGQFVATTSFDHTWRLWDVETSSAGRELLLQDGHAREVYGVGFHPDGSLVASTDFGGVVQCWDLRTGKSACHFLGHARRVLVAEFSPNGFQLATAGDDGTIKIWDLRRRRPSASVPAHTNLITQLKFAHSTSSQNGEFLASSSFDGTGKIWSTRDWRLLTSLQGHEGKVMGIDVLDGPGCGIVTCGFDKTLKLWQ